MQQWTTRDQEDEGANGAWKFNKTRQTFLLKFWSHRQRVSGDTFKLFLQYATSLPAACAARTATQARELAESAEKEATLILEQQEQQAANASAGGGADDGDDDDDATTTAALEEKRAVLMIQTARATRLLQVLAPE